MPHGTLLQSRTLKGLGPASLVPSSVASDSRTKFNVLAYGAKGDGITDDTAAIQAAINAACAVAGSFSRGATVYFPPGDFIATQLTVGASDVTLQGDGMFSSVVHQKAGAATWVLGSSAFPLQRVRVADLGINCFASAATNAGGIFWQGISEGIIERVSVFYANNFGIQIMGGGDAESGDAMYNVIDKCSIQNLGAGAAHIRLTPQAPVSTDPGSHPDRTRITSNFFHSALANNTIGVLMDQPVNLTGSYGADGAYVSGNTMQGVKFPFDVNTSYSTFIGNTCETTVIAGTMQVNVRQGPASYRSNMNIFVGNTYYTLGVSQNFTFQDDGVATHRWDGWLWASSTGAARNSTATPEYGVALNTLRTDEIDNFTDGPSIAIRQTIAHTQTYNNYPHFGMSPMSAGPSIPTGRRKGMLLDNNSSVGLYAASGANGGVRAWLDTGSGTAVQGNVFEDGSGGFVFRNSGGALSRLSSGTGAPSAGANGDVYLQQNATGATLAIWVKIGGTWTTLKTANDALYQPQWPGLVAPVHPMLIAAGSAWTANQLRTCRVIIPKSGTLHDVSAYVTVQSGNCIAAVYDTGDASAGNRSLLWSSGSVAVGTINTWQVVGDPALAVTAGQELDFALIPDNGTAAFGRLNVAGGGATLPTGFWPAAGGALPKLAWAFTNGSFSAPATVAEASCFNSGTCPVLIARVA